MLIRRFSIGYIGLLLLSLSSCSEKFKVAAPYKNITVVAGLLDMTDTAHYVRIEKAFMDENRSALVMSQNPDSSYFPQLNVVIRMINNGVVAKTIILNRVDMALEGYPKDSGAFFTSPSYAYKFTDTLDPSYTYRLVIYNPRSGETDSAETPILNSDPSVFRVPRFQYISDTFSIARSTPGYNFFLSGYGPPNAVIFQAVMRFFYVDSSVIDGSVRLKYVDWQMGDAQASSNNAFVFQIPNIEFYSFLRDAIGPPASGIERYMDSMNIFITAGAQELYNYSTITNAQNVGLTSWEIKPLYTNMKGANVLGLFSSRVVIKYYRMHIDKESLDSLEANPITQLINIHGFY